MRLIFVIIAATFLSSCVVERTSIENIKPDSSIRTRLPIAGKILVFVPKKDARYKVLYRNPNAETLIESGAELQKASIDVMSKYFSEVNEFSYDMPTNYWIKVESQTQYVPGWGMRLIVKTALYKSSGELVEKKELFGGIDGGFSVDENAFYNAYVRMLKGYMNELFLDHSDDVIKYVSSTSPIGISADQLRADGFIEMYGTGSGFFINDAGFIVTNYHVVDKCLTLMVNHNGSQLKATVEAVDEGADIAVLSVDLKTTSFAYFADLASDVRLGEEIITVGYPLHGVLSKEPSLTTGNISALAGINGDENHFQISAPVQPGNSGGPLIGKNGLVYGVVQGKLNAMLLAEFTGDIAQNVNFAIKENTVMQVFDKHHITYTTKKSSDTKKMEIPDIADKATQYTLQVMCYG